MIKTFFEEIFYCADIFKVPFILLFQNRKQSSTLLGSLFSIGIFAIVAYLFFSSNMLLKINPFVIDQTTTNNHAALIELNPKNFEIAAGVANSYGIGFSDPTIFKIQFIQIEINQNESINSKQITKKEIKTIQTCNNQSFSDPNTFDDLGLAKYACLKNGTFTLEGGFDEKAIKAVVVLISYCDNKTDGIVCKPQTDINNFFKDKGLWLYYQDDIYDVSNYKTPIKKNWRLQAIQCAAVPRIIDLYLKKLEFINDEGLLFTNDEVTYGFMKERSEGLSDYVMVDSPLISINLFSSKNSQTTKRQYQKFGDLLASIGGVINVLIIVGFSATNLKNQLQMQNHIMNSLYDYSFDKKQKKPKNQKRLKVEEKDHKLNPDWTIDCEENVTIKKEHPKTEEKELKIGEPDEIQRNETFDFMKELHPSLLKLDLTCSKNNSINEKSIEFDKSPKLHLDFQSSLNYIKPSNEHRKSIFTKFESFSKKLNTDKSIVSGPNKERVLSPGLEPKYLSKISESHEFEIKVKESHENQRVSLSLSEFIIMKIKDIFRRKLSIKEKLFELSEKRFRNETDIVSILEKIQEFEKFKMIFFNEKQLVLFNLLAKPLIYLESQREKFRTRSSFLLSNYLVEEKNSKTKISELKEHYKLLNDQTNLSEIDKKLMKLIENDIFSN